MKRNLVVAFFLCLSLASPSRTTAAVPQGVQLQLELERHQYLFAQPIVFIVQLVNGSSEDLKDMGDLMPEVGYLAFRLTRGGETVPPTGPQDLRVFTSPGPTLRSHSAMCEVIDVLDWFGVEEPGSGTLRVLPPGTYVLSASFRLHLSEGKDWVRSGSVEFEIEAPAPQEAEALERLRKISRIMSRDCAVEWIPSVLDTAWTMSDYHAAMVRRLSPWMTKDQIVDAARSMEKSGSRYGALLVLRSGLVKVGHHYQEAIDWLRVVRVSFPDARSECVLRWWETMIEEAHKTGNN